MSQFWLTQSMSIYLTKKLFSLGHPNPCPFYFPVNQVRARDMQKIRDNRKGEIRIHDMPNSRGYSHTNTSTKGLLDDNHSSSSSKLHHGPLWTDALLLVFSELSKNSDNGCNKSHGSKCRKQKEKGHSTYQSTQSDEETESWRSLLSTEATNRNSANDLWLPSSRNLSSPEDCVYRESKKALYY